MRKYYRELLDFFRKGDMVLLLLCALTTAYGLVIISSVTAYMNSTRFVVVQLLGAVLGVCLYALLSSIDLDALLEHRVGMTMFNVFLLLLIIPFGVDNGSGNKSWLDLPLLPINIQPAEICKVTFILVLTAVMSSHQNRLSKIPSVLHMAAHLIGLFGLNVVLSRDLGVSLIFVFVFLGMAFAGGVGRLWFLVGSAGAVALAPIAWQFMEPYQKNRIMMLFDPSIDPSATGVRWHTNQGLLSLTGGGLTGQGLYNGQRTQAGALTAQHTDFIFCAAGEEFGFLGCLVIVLLEFAIIARIIYVGMRSPDFARRVVCFGAASALIFQVTINLGMCLGVLPVIGLTLPFISYGGSSILSLYAMLGFVSGVYARPAPGKQGMYIQPPR